MFNLWTWGPGDFGTFWDLGTLGLWDFGTGSIGETEGSPRLLVTPSPRHPIRIILFWNSYNFKVPT